jgi:hypothetical protein
MRRHYLFALIACCFANISFAESCRVAFDLGSSGIRAGASNSSTVTRTDIDYLGALWHENGLERITQPTIEALKNLPRKAEFDETCERVAGGFSAWRLALEQNPTALTQTLAYIREKSGVPILVIPQNQEGFYGYHGAKQLLGERLKTSHVLDLGGGSLQIAGEHQTFILSLGQKVWHRQLCQHLRHTDEKHCALLPLTETDLEKARAFLAEKLHNIPTALPEQISLTAVSRPVSRGIVPILQRLLGDNATPTISRTSISTAIKHLADNLSEQPPTPLDTKNHLMYAVSDLLLLEGLMSATHLETLHVAEIDLTNLPGLLSDDRAFKWGQHYSCYLNLLTQNGESAYFNDTKNCPP